MWNSEVEYGVVQRSVTSVVLCGIMLYVLTIKAEEVLSLWLQFDAR